VQFRDIRYIVVNYCVDPASGV